MTKIEHNKVTYTPSVWRTARTFSPGIKYQDSTFLPEIAHSQSLFAPEIIKSDPAISVISPFENSWIIDLNGQYAMDLTFVRIKGWQISN